MIEFVRKFENRGMHFFRVNSILITQSINLQFFTSILYGVGVRCDRRRFSVHSSSIAKSMVIFINTYQFVDGLAAGIKLFENNCISSIDFHIKKF